MKEKVVIVFETDEDGGYVSVLLYARFTIALENKTSISLLLAELLEVRMWELNIVEGNCRAIDFYGRRFKVNLENGEIISKDIVW